MKLYDSLFGQLNSLLEQKLHLSYTPSSNWIIGDSNQLIFKNETALELGGSSKVAVAGLLISSDPTLIGDEEVIVYGPDIKDLEGDSNYLRIALVQVDDEKMGEGKDIYSSIRKIDYVRYHINPLGAMFRISPLASKESIVISKSAKKDGISLKDIGSQFISAFDKLPQVKKSKVIFITEPNFDYASLEVILKKGEDITKALDHLLGKVKMDCHSCSLQKVCEEVETLCKEEFKDKQ